MMQEATLLTTAGCHLCDQALAIIRRAAPTLQVALLDIADDDALIAEYGERIPVLRIRDQELQWPFSLLDVRQAVAAG